LRRNKIFITLVSGSEPHLLCRPSRRLKTSDTTMPGRHSRNTRTCIRIEVSSKATMRAGPATSSGEAADMPVKASTNRIWIPFIPGQQQATPSVSKIPTEDVQAHSSDKPCLPCTFRGQRTAALQHPIWRNPCASKDGTPLGARSHEPMPEDAKRSHEELRAGEHGIEQGWGRGKRLTPCRSTRDHPSDPSRVQRSSGIAYWCAQRPPSAVWDSWGRSPTRRREKWEFH
jgi:hypothetical protein